MRSHEFILASKDSKGKIGVNRRVKNDFFNKTPNPRLLDSERVLRGFSP